MKTLTKLAVVVLALTFLFSGCVVAEFPEEKEEVSKISQQKAMEIALEYAADSQYEATSALFGPYSKDAEVDIWVVNLLGEGNVLFVYVDAETGEIYDEEFHQFPEDAAEDQDEILPKSGGMCAGYCHWYVYVHIPGFYSQRDYHWSGHRLGYGYTTIGSHGCHLTTVSMILYRLGHHDRNPAQLNDYAKRSGCFSGDLLDGQCIMRKHGRNARFIGVDEVWGNLARGIPVIAAVGYAGGRHFMLIYGHDGRRYWVKDPLQDGRHQNQPLYGDYVGWGTYRVYN